jgi:N-acetylglutamate synthase-like GNAT family acetyltransferase
MVQGILVLIPHDDAMLLDNIAVDPNAQGQGLALQLPFLKISESMGNHDSKIVDADSVD